MDGRNLSNEGYLRPAEEDKGDVLVVYFIVRNYHCVNQQMNIISG